MEGGGGWSSTESKGRVFFKAWETTAVGTELVGGKAEKTWEWKGNAIAQPSQEGRSGEAQAERLLPTEVHQWQAPTTDKRCACGAQTMLSLLAGSRIFQTSL